MPFYLTLGDGKNSKDTFEVTLSSKAGGTRVRTFMYDPKKIGVKQEAIGTIPLDRANLPVGSVFVYEAAPTSEKK